jgi:hypothetical protein
MLKILEDKNTTQPESTSLSEQGYKEEDLREWPTDYWMEPPTEPKGVTHRL